MKMTLNDMADMVEGALSNMYRDNWFFFEHRVGEWTISSEFHYIMKVLYASRFVEYDMDAEYNLMTLVDDCVAQKTIVDDRGRPLKIRPDFIIHKRGNPLGNFLCVELKRRSGKRIKHDFLKLERLTGINNAVGLKYVSNYMFGVSVLMLKRTIKCRWYVGGKCAMERFARVKNDGGIITLLWG